MKFAVYRTDTGEIVRVCDTSPSQVLIQAGEGEEIYLNVPDDATHIIDGEPVVITPPPVDPVPAAMDRLRAQRGMLLLACDWTQLADSPLSTERREAWAAYRQELRDMPATADPLNPVWPVPPS